MVAILAGLKVFIAFMFKYVIKVVAIGFVLVLFIIAAWHSVEQKNLDPFMKEFGGRILLVDKTVEERLGGLAMAEEVNFGKNIFAYLTVILDILMLYYIIKFTKWAITFITGTTVPGMTRIIIAILIMALAEVFYAKVFLGYYVVPFVGFSSVLTQFVPLILIPFAQWFATTFHISEVPLLGNETMSWWDRIFM